MNQQMNTLNSTSKLSGMIGFSIESIFRPKLEMKMDWILPKKNNTVSLFISFPCASVLPSFLVLFRDIYLNQAEITVQQQWIINIEKEMRNEPPRNSLPGLIHSEKHTIYRI